MQINQVIETYDQGAVDYDAIMKRYWHIEREPLIASLQLKPGQTVLDAAVGTGLNLSAYPEGVNVVGVDLSEKMLDEARKKRVSADITFKVADMCNLDFPDNSFDAAASGFTLCVVKDPVLALKEILRVTKPGAFIAILDYCKSQNPEFYKWQELIFDATAQLGFPTGKIKWNALMDYDELIYKSKLPIEVLVDDRTENPNPFLCGCQLLLKNLKG
ncbi:methyltransferase domain-containing protein [Nostoc sp. FACHB-888]|uniref:class I SAM-dependent methyltransferase n=1 Tax=Nostoc sp. FACHB-888 TaxID=2692842 RepID=UPI00168A0246|nr:methyltransferase domain-containing protein [Nostoc sp. FACHB-888]MBD2245800.1 methyltransferase domain-containing protein [Nostoc sp. FACHB-888]MCC5653910.1 methyltransferase domain-containing protein [Nostoc sp. XA013]